MTTHDRLLLAEKHSNPFRVSAALRYANELAEHAGMNIELPSFKIIFAFPIPVPVFSIQIIFTILIVIVVNFFDKLYIIREPNLTGGNGFPFVQ